MKPLFFILLTGLFSLSVKVQAQCCNTTYNVPVTINGVDITGSGSGLYSIGAGFPDIWCGIKQPDAVVHLGGIATPPNTTTGSYTYYFSSPISEIILLGNTFNDDDIVEFTTNGVGTTSLSLNSSCLSNLILSGNILTATPVTTFQAYSAYIKVSNTGGTFTQLTITNAPPNTHLNTSGVSFAICSISEVPQTSLITSTPELSTNYLNNICPTTTVDLTAIITNPPPVGVDVVWFDNVSHSGTSYPTPDVATSGIYYAFFYDAVQNCYSPASAPIVVETMSCDPCFMAFQSFNPIVLSSFNGIISNVNFTGKVYIINDITLDDNVSFTDAEVLLEPNVKIKVSHNLDIISSHFYTCSGRWKGIEVIGTPMINIDGSNTSSTPPFIPKSSSLIEDAETAIFVDYQDPLFIEMNYININNTIFNRNNIGIHLENFTKNPNNETIYPVSIKNTIFTCRKIPFVPGNKTWDNLNTILGITLTYPKTPSGYEAPYIFNTIYPDDAPEAYLKDSTASNGYGTQKSTIGIQVSTVHGTTASNDPVSLLIGNGSNNNPYSCNTLVFDNHNIGIQATNANITVNNCTFQKPAGFNGYGILSMGECVPVSTDAFGNTQYDCVNNNIITINTPSGTPDNAFFNMRTAISIADGKQVTVKDCAIRSAQSKADIDDYLYLPGSYGIGIGNHYFENIDISNNKIYNVRNPINIFCARDMRPYNYIDPIDVGNILVEGNMIGRQFFDENTVITGDEYIENAINIASLYLYHENGAPVQCKNNTIHEAINGIKLSYWQNKHTQVDSNTITLMEHPTNTNSNYETYGICLEAGFGINETGLGNTVEGNEINGAGMSANGNSTGILLKQQGNTNIGCNVVNDNKHAFRFFGNNPNTKFWDNVMYPTNQYGFTLENGGIIGMQGNWNSNLGMICPSNNSWVYETSWDAGNDQYMTNCISSLPSQSPLVVLDMPGLNPDGSGISFPVNGYGYQHTGDPSTELIWYAIDNDVECQRCADATLYLRSAEDFTILEQIADGTILLLNDEPEDRLLVMQEQLFELLHSQPDLLANSNSLQQFIYNNQWTSFDFIYYAGQLLAEGNMGMLEILMDNWTPENNNLSEAYYAYFEWLLNMYGDLNYQPDLNEVWELANQCPLTHGTIVYAVRNLYNALTEQINDFENNCEPPQQRGNSNKPQFIRLKEPKKKTEIQEQQKSKLVLYPNPATSIINIEFTNMKQISIMDITGRAILNKQVNGVNNLQLNVAGIGKGVFIVKVTGKDGNIQTQKLIVQ